VGAPQLALILAVAVFGVGPAPLERDGDWGWDRGRGCEGARDIVRIDGASITWIENGRVVRRGAQFERHVFIRDNFDPKPTGVRWRYIENGHAIEDRFAVAYWRGRPHITLAFRFTDGVRDNRPPRDGGRLAHCG